MSMRPHPRRSTHRVAALALTVVLAMAAVACGGDDGDDDEASAGTTTAAVAGDTAGDAADGGDELEQVTIALDFFPSVYFSGIYAAIANGYFEEVGIEVEILPFSGTPAETLIESGQTDLAISYPPDVIINRANGLEYRAVAGLVNENTTALVVLEDSEYQRPADLDGLLYGGFGVASDPPLVSAILAADGVEEPAFDQIVLSTDAVTALQAGEVQYTAVFGGVGDIISEQQGIALRLFPYRDFLGDSGNYPNSVYVASDETIAERGDVLRRTLQALARGYQFAAENPDEAGRILIEANPTELAQAETIVELTGRATAPVFLDEDGAWGTLVDTDFAGLAEILRDAGVITEIPPLEDLYTNDLLPGS